jgi:hypothetical protein
MSATDSHHFPSAEKEQEMFDDAKAGEDNRPVAKTESAARRTTGFLILSLDDTSNDADSGGDNHPSTEAETSAGRATFVSTSALDNTLLIVPLIASAEASNEKRMVQGCPL